MNAEHNPQAEQMGDESMARNLAHQANAIWPQEQRLFERYDLPQASRILDLGCGTGEITRRLGERYPQAQLKGIDILEGNLAVARRDSADFADRIAYEVGDAFALHYADASFDLVVCRHMSQAVPDFPLVLAEITRVLKPGGWLHLLSEDYVMLHAPATGGRDPESFNRNAIAFLGGIGCDGRIGRHSPALLETAGYHEIAMDYVVVDTLRVPRATFAGILRAWRDGYAAPLSEASGRPLAEVTGDFDAMIAAIETPPHYVVWQVPVISARRPPRKQVRDPTAMTPLRFDNAFLRELPGDPESGFRLRQVHGGVWSRVEPTPVAAPRLLAHSAEVAALLGLGESDVASPEFAQVFAGNALFDGMQAYASNYGGHQFGHWAGQLGDGRAIMLGEAVTASGARFELQLKGAGPTPYSRNADGRAVLRSSIREFLCSEAMHHLGVPTTRALSLVATGEDVVRDMFYDGHPHAEPGAIVCRVAPSFIRFGHFELPASRGDVELLRKLVDFTIHRDFPELHGEGESLRGDWFAQVRERTARMVAGWMRTGFVHGVMNTDNMSILGLTIDYGPYGWIDDYDPDWTPNTTDAQGRRYRFGTQPQIACWNLGRLANALAPVFGSHDVLHAGLQRFAETYTSTDRDNIARKLGLRECGDEDVELMQSLHGLMRDAEVDMTIFFRALADASIDADSAASSLDPFVDAFYEEAKRRRFEPDFRGWLARLATRVARDAMPADERRACMRMANPRYVLRNYLAQQAIDRAGQGDPAGVVELLDVMRRPYDDQPGREDFAKRRPDWARNRAGCSMLSCSS